VLPLRHQYTDLAFSFGKKKNASKCPRNKLVGDKLIGTQHLQGAHFITQRQTFEVDPVSHLFFPVVLFFCSCLFCDSFQVSKFWGLFYCVWWVWNARLSWQRLYFSLKPVSNPWIRICDTDPIQICVNMQIKFHNRFSVVGCMFFAHLLHQDNHHLMLHLTPPLS
jgi:hypothetical protein